MSPKPWHLEGPTSGKNHPGLEDALARLWLGRPGPATEADRPPPSTFPMTPAARVALRLSRVEGEGVSLTAGAAPPEPPSTDTARAVS